MSFLNSLLEFPHTQKAFANPEAFKAGAEYRTGLTQFDHDMPDFCPPGQSWIPAQRPDHAARGIEKERKRRDGNRARNQEMDDHRPPRYPSLASQHKNGTGQN